MGHRSRSQSGAEVPNFHTKYDTGWVVPTLVNKNRLDLGRYKTILPEEDGRSDPTTARDRSSLQKRRHLDPAFHQAALNGLKRGRESRMWSESEMLQAIRDFVRKEGRAPQQHEFRRDLGMPGYGTVWRRLGPVTDVISRALSE
jgi:HNH endonuclease